MNYLLATITLAASIGQLTAEQAALASLFSDYMVLQRDQAVPVWGTANPGTEVTVQFDGQTIKAVTNEEGKWLVQLAPMDASAEARQLQVNIGDVSKEINDVLVGEVWFCSGQSNMFFTLDMMLKDAREPQYQPLVEFLKEEVKTANDPLLRQISVPNRPSPFAEAHSFDSSWTPLSPQSSNKFGATSYFFAKELRKELQVPVGIIKCAVGGTRVEAWIPKEVLESNDNLKAYYQNNLEKAAEKAKQQSPEAVKKAAEAHKLALAEWQKNKQGPRPRLDPPTKTNKQFPATLFNGMVAQCIPYSVRGVLWYQGESNANHYQEVYSQRYMAMVQGWRKRWGNDELPFYHVQLAGFRESEGDAGDDSSFAFIREQQRLTLELANTGMAVAHDIGESQDIHPHNKYDVGKRLALLALANDYAKDIVSSGPLYRSHQLDGQDLVIKFDSTGSGLTASTKTLMQPAKATNDELGGFAMQDASGQWHWAKAKIISADEVKVSHPEISAPKAVRYAWAGLPLKANLYNKEGLPASVFTIELK